MEKKEKYKSFAEMKANSTPTSSTNVAAAMERHATLESFVGFLRSEHEKKSAQKNKNPASHA